MTGENLPVLPFLPKIVRTAATKRKLILSAAPGAGKTMLVPPAVAAALPGKVIIVEPRRIAAKAAAAGMAAMQAWKLGKECGFSVRGEHCRSAETKILAVTPGVLLNRMQDDPGLEGISAVIFDEFHERGVESDLALTLILDLCGSLRDDLAIIVMSATLENERLASLLDAPVIEVPGKGYPLEIIHKECSRDFRDVPAECARAVLESCRSLTGDILVFLPGKREIDRCAEMLSPALPEMKIVKLHGSLTLSEQSAALAPAPHRKVILATNIAESSLTVEGVKIVIDSGWERRMRYSPGAGMPFLEPGRITLASAIQRSGRAARCAPGTAIRLWSAADERNFRAAIVPEILECDQSFLTLELAAWGAAPEQLRWLDPPPEAGRSAALELLNRLGLMDSEKHLTSQGKEAEKLPVHPRLAAMLLRARDKNLLPLATEVAALLAERDDLHGGDGADLRLRLENFRRNPRRYPAKNELCRRLRSHFNVPQESPANSTDAENCALLLAFAAPEWIGRARTRHGTVYQLAGGRAAALQENDPLRGSEYLAIADLSGFSGRDAAIRLAAPLSRTEIEENFSDSITETTETFFEPENNRIGGRKLRRLESLILDESPCPADQAALARAVLTEALRRKLPLPPPEMKSAVRLLERVRFARRNGEEELPEWGEENFAAALLELAPPFLNGVRNFAQLEKSPWHEILNSALSYDQKQKLDRLYPDRYTAPTGMSFAIDYSGEQPALALQIQQLYGETVHPAVGSRKLPLKLELLSPGGKPVQITGDLPGFWRGSWKLVRTEMRSRYPKHEWPEDPESASPMRRSIKRRS